MKTIIVVALTMFAAVLAAACSGSASAPTSTPTPTAAPELLTYYLEYCDAYYTDTQQLPATADSPYFTSFSDVTVQGQGKVGLVSHDGSMTMFGRCSFYRGKSPFLGKNVLTCYTQDTVAPDITLPDEVEDPFALASKHTFALYYTEFADGKKYVWLIGLTQGGLLGQFTQSFSDCSLKAW